MRLLSWLRLIGAVGARPWLWPTAIVQLFRLARRGWWRRPPFLPVPDRDYLRFRLETMYGGDLRGWDRVEARHLLEYLRWCRAFPR